MQKKEIKLLFDAYFRHYNSGDFRMALNKHYTEDAVFENTRVKVVGRENIIEWFTRSHDLGYTETLSETNMLVGEDGIAVELEQEFHGLEDVPNHYVSPLRKGETIRTSGVAALYRLRDDRICSVRVYCTLSEYNPRIHDRGGPDTEINHCGCKGEDNDRE